jgi:hypothetical protein
MSSRSIGFRARDTELLESRPGKRDAVHLPVEVLLTIISFIKLQENARSALHSCCLVSRSWYSVAVAPLYQSPLLESANYPLFFRTICLSKNVRNLESPLSEYVKTLDLSAWLHEVIREDDVEILLARLERRLEIFVARMDVS